MNALTQYIDLYDANRQLIDAGGANPLNNLRPEARKLLEHIVLPKPNSPGYENTDLPAMLAPDYGINLANIDIDINPAATFRCDVPAITPTPLLMLNDKCIAGNTADDLPEGVEAGSLRSFALNHPDEIAQRYGTLADMANPITSLNTLLAQDGFYLRVKRGVKLKKPLQLVSILQNGSPLMAVRRLLIIVEPDAEAKLVVCNHTQNPDVDFLDLETVEIFTEENAMFDYYALEESTLRTGRLSTLYLDQKQNSHVTIEGITLFNGTTRNEYICGLNGEHATLRLLGMGIEDKNRRTSVATCIEHNVPNCKSDELFKFTVDDEAKAAFAGRIYVAPGARGTEAYQSNRNLVGSDTARMESKPELEIYNDDVKCSHGTATGQLDALQLFYMRTRGLDEATARLLLKQAFMADIIDGVRIEALRDRLLHLTEMRYAGKASACSSCSANCPVNP